MNVPNTKSISAHLMTKAAALRSSDPQLAENLMKVASEVQTFSKTASMEAVNAAAEIRAQEMAKLAQVMEDQGEELQYEDVIDLVNPDGSNDMEQLVTELAMGKLQEAGQVE